MTNYGQSYTDMIINIRKKFFIKSLFIYLFTNNPNIHRLCGVGMYEKRGLMVKAT